MIYEIVCNKTGERYYGSTFNSNKRLISHMCLSNKTKSKSIIDRGDYIFKIIEKLDNPSKEELLIKEKEYIFNNECINKYSPITTIEEKKKQNIKRASNYYYNNKEYVLKSKKEFYNLNKDILNAKKKEIINCSCGKNYIKGNKSRHLSSKFHINNITV